MGKVRGVRFSDEDEKLIEEFLRKNSLIDFSTLAKVAILDFIKKPQIHLIPVGNIPLQKERQNVGPNT